MSILGSIMTKIFGGPAAAQAVAPQATGTPTVTAGGGTGLGGPSGGASSAAAPTMSGAASPVTGTPESVDVGAVLQAMAVRSGQSLDYKRSIVDLMKLLGLDSGLSARQELARELHYPGDTGDSAAMNVWLHAQVMHKLAENGGRVPDDLRHT